VIKLREDLTLYHDRYFPDTKRAKSSFKHCATLGIGGNLGDVRARFHKLYLYLQQSRQLQIIATSPILRNPPFGYLEQPDFYNAIMIIKTNLSPHKLLRYLLFVERRFKRTRAFANSPRTLDIDMIFYDKMSINTRYLTIPHPHFHQRESVLIPLNFIKNQVCE
jgi:2-amino-4-hydroxy-6-hydroxymethyldihydropteridine diphosphokinase